MNKSPADEFKRCLGAATKAISGEPEMEVSFGGDVAGIVRDQVMLPSLPPKPNPEQIAKARGLCTTNSHTPRTSPAQALPARSSKPWSKPASKL